ncbi:Ig-like domain-containing protein [Companilactobacillus keshanensis]|uniref:Ig-like domain-containing protein n=1 Tax=Companilactobacillus keshanensis TaxID=2486003 RepID=A0ABW4BVS6_9LACO|nr:Ig-like domain-containing protein [Companilactobacillus keshanensis]
MQIKKLSITLLTFLLTISCFQLNGLKVSAEDTGGDTNTEDIGYYHKPTKDVKKFFGIWLTTGFALQPKAENNVVVGDTITLRTDSARSAIFAAATLDRWAVYQWYKFTPGDKGWTAVSKNDGGKKENLVITGKTANETTYYQLQVRWRNIIINSLAKKIYSQVAAVHTVPYPIDGEEMTVKTDDDYIYSTSFDMAATSTYAHADIIPENYTGNVTWSVDDKSLATIDEDTGLLTAVTKKEVQGTVTVTGTLHNPVGDDLQATTEVRVGQGLEDQTVKAGEEATFAIQGNLGDLEDIDDGGDDGDEGGDGSDGSEYTVKWYRDNPDGSRVQVNKGDELNGALSVTSDPTNMEDDNQSRYQAVINVKLGVINKNYTTNKATLTVIPDGSPDITVNNSITNVEYHDELDSDLHLFGVNEGDKITEESIITNNSGTGILSAASYHVPIRETSTINSVVVDDKELSDDEYKVVTKSKTGTKELVVPNLSFSTKQSHSIQVTSSVGSVDEKETLHTTPYILGQVSTADDYRSDGSEEAITYSTNTIQMNAEDIHFGNINPLSSNKTIYRPDELNEPQNVIEIDDQRRNKNHAEVRAQQDGEFLNSENVKLFGNLTFVNNGTVHDLLENDQLIQSTSEGNSVPSIGWSRENGILLHISDANLTNGNFKTKINWSIVESI